MTHFFAIQGNAQKLDGGAMFGHVPKTLWRQWIAPDDDNRVTLACRGLLVREGGRHILLETGIGAFLNPAMKERYGVQASEHVLLQSLRRHGLSDSDIDIVVLSHLHFDHAGGLLSSWREDAAPELLFPKATFIVSKLAWERACHPHLRDRASFIPELQGMLERSGRLLLVDEDGCQLLGDSYQFKLSHGHTPGLLHTVVKLPGE